EAADLRGVLAEVDEAGLGHGGVGAVLSGGGELVGLPGEFFDADEDLGWVFDAERAAVEGVAADGASGFGLELVEVVGGDDAGVPGFAGSLPDADDVFEVVACLGVERAGEVGPPLAVRGGVAGVGDEWGGGFLCFDDEPGLE